MGRIAIMAAMRAHFCQTVPALRAEHEADVEIGRSSGTFSPV
jgi:hypothetical protein